MSFSLDSNWGVVDRAQVSGSEDPALISNSEVDFGPYRTRVRLKGAGGTICLETHDSDGEHLDELSWSLRNPSGSLTGESGRVHFVNQLSLCGLLPDGWRPPSQLPLLPHLASAARAESGWHPDGSIVGTVLREAVKDPGSLSFGSAIFNLKRTPHDHKKAATAARIACSSNHSESRRGLAATTIYHGAKSWSTCYSKLTMSTGNGIMPGSDQAWFNPSGRGRGPPAPNRLSPE